MVEHEHLVSEPSAFAARLLIPISGFQHFTRFYTDYEFNPYY